MRAQRGLRLLWVKGPAPPARPLSLPEEHRQRWSLFPIWKTAGAGRVPVKGEPRGLKPSVGTKGRCSRVAQPKGQN